MAGIRKKGDAYYCTFRFQGRRFYFTVGDVTEAQALAKGAEVDETLGLLERGRFSVPDGVALEDFVAAGGRVPVVSARPETTTAPTCRSVPRHARQRHHRREFAGHCEIPPQPVYRLGRRALSHPRPHSVGPPGGTSTAAARKASRR